MLAPESYGTDYGYCYACLQPNSPSTCSYFSREPPEKLLYGCSFRQQHSAQMSERQTSLCLPSICPKPLSRGNHEAVDHPSQQRSWLHSSCSVFFPLHNTLRYNYDWLWFYLLSPPVGCKAHKGCLFHVLMHPNASDSDWHMSSVNTELVKKWVIL